MSAVERLRVRTRVPLWRCRGEALLGRPCVRGDDGHRVIEPDDLAHAAHGHRFRFVDRNELSTERRRSGHHSELHSRQPDIDAELRAAVDLARAVETPVRRSDQLEVARLFERNFVRNRQLRRGIHQPAVAEPAAGRHMNDRAVLARGRWTGQRSSVAPLPSPA